MNEQTKAVIRQIYNLTADNAGDRETQANCWIELLDTLIDVTRQDVQVTLNNKGRNFSSKDDIVEVVCRCMDFDFSDLLA